MHPYYNQAMTMVGRPVCVHAYNQVHYGILNNVTDGGVYLRRTPAGVGVADRVTPQIGGFSTQTSIAPALHHMTNPQDRQAGHEADNVFWLWPFFFLPWLAILALRPWYY